MPGQPGRHDEVEWEPVAHRTIAIWPPGTFVENLAPLPAGGFVVSLHNRHELIRVAPDGSQDPMAELPVPPTGIVVADDRLYVAGGEPGVGPHGIFEVGADGRVRRLLDVPDSLFLNGFVPARPGFGFCVDSLLGAVFEVDLVHATSRPVLEHELLGKISSEPMLPGVNGIELGDEALWLTNTDRALVLRAGLGADGPDGSLDVVAEHMRGDDLARDRQGSLYLTTRIHNSVIRLDPDGRRVALAGPDQGMHGSTACRFGLGADDDALFVTTTGGVVMPVDDTPREAKLVRLEVGRRAQRPA